MSRHNVKTYQGKELTRNSSGHARPQSSQLADPLWVDPGLKSVIGALELISTYGRKEKSAVRRWILEPSSQIPEREGKAAHPLGIFLRDGKEENIGVLRPQKPLRLIRDGEVRGSGNFISNTYSLHRHHQNDSALRWAVVWAILMFY